MRIKRFYKIVTVISISILLISLNTGDLNETHQKNTDYSLIDTSNNPSFKITQSTEDANIDHNLVDKFSFTFGTNSNDSVRHITLGYPHPDGILRLLIGSSQKTNGSLHVLKQSGDPYSYVKEGEYIYSNQEWSYLEPILTYDFDRDGVEEILTCLYDPSGILFVGWNGTGYYPKWESISSQMTVQSGAQIYDIDRDGKPELITYSYSSTNVYSWDYGFVNFTHDATLAGGGWDVGIGDIDRDGEAEIITTMTGSDSSVRIWGFDGNNYVQEYINYYLGHEKGFISFCVVDIDNDDHLELIGGTPNWGGIPYLITMFEWNGLDLIPHNLTQDTAAHYDIKAGDIDGDGLDEVVIDRNGGHSTIIELAPNGSIVLQDYNILSIYHCIELYDLDGDYIPEIIVGPSGYSTWTLIYQDDVHGPPTLIDTSPSSITVEQNSLGNNVSWTPIDRQNLTYSLYWESSMIVATTDCFSGVPIVSSLNYRLGSPGTYNLTVVVVDDDLNKTIHSVFVTVVPSDVPTISNVKRSPVNPTAGENVTISANITDRSGIFSADLYYQVDNTGWYIETLIWQFDDIYQAEIGPFMFGQEIKYYITAMDDTTDHNMVTDNNFGAYYSFKLVDTTGPTITNVYHSPSDPIEGDKIIIYADIDDESGISSVEAYIQTNGGGWTSILMEYQSGITFRTNIGFFTADTKIEYYIKANDASESKNKATNDNKGNYYSIYISSIPKSSTEQTTTSTEAEDTSEEPTSEQAEISISTPIKITGLELVLLVLGAVFYRNYKHKK